MCVVWHNYNSLILKTDLTAAENMNRLYRHAGVKAEPKRVAPGIATDFESLSTFFPRLVTK